MSDKERAYFKKSTNDLLRAIAGEEPEADPMYNEETNAIIAAIKENGGSSLPDVTASDNGMVLTVVDGEWDKANPSGGGTSDCVLVINENEGTLDKTWDEIANAIAGGKLCVIPNVYISDEKIEEAGFYFVTGVGIENESYTVTCNFEEDYTFIATNRDDYPIFD